MFYSRATFYAGVTFQRQHINPKSCIVRMHLENPSNHAWSTCFCMCVHSTAWSTHCQQDTVCKTCGKWDRHQGLILTPLFRFLHGMACWIACVIDIFSFFYFLSYLFWALIVEFAKVKCAYGVTELYILCCHSWSCLTWTLFLSPCLKIQRQSHPQHR